MTTGPQGPQGIQGPIGPRGSISLKIAFVLIFIGMGIAAFLILSDSNAKDKKDDSAPTEELSLVTASAPADCKFLTGTNGGTAFCDSFDSPSDGSTRAGELNGVIWGVSRATGNQNLSGAFNSWESTTVEGCPGPNPAPPTDDVRVCNGQLREATSDAHTVTTLAMYPKQPFDIANRVGTVVFDVGNDTQGTHAAWPEFWWTDQPVPAPYQHLDDWYANPRNGLGLSFAAGRCGENTFAVDRMVISKDYTATIYDNLANNTNQPNCVLKGSQSALNHIEVKLSIGKIDVYASDPGSTTMKQIFHYDVALPLTRGLVWIEDVHYNAVKGGAGTQHTHTFVWDNVGFDGPFTYKDLSYDVLDNNVPSPSAECPTCASTGWRVLNEADATTLHTLPIPAGVTGQAARLMFNYFPYDPVTTFNFSVNGHVHSASAPSAFTSRGYTQRTIAFDIPTTDLVVGPQSIKIWGNQPFIYANVNIVLVDTSGVVVTPTPTPQIPPTATAPPNSTPALPTRTPVSGIKRQCTLRWGSTTLENYGLLTQLECANRGQ